MQEKIIEENKAEFYDKVNNKRALMHKQSKEKATIEASFVKKKRISSYRKMLRTTVQLDSKEVPWMLL